ncbi:MAG: polysaccharide deacetylase family protein [Chitinophagaceae bacterium]|nr:polysaccharide deacetylase family protein [Chitinophagaceae bacterium]MCW5905330.1 polysaccharide deacetylase family protein [Chitinophagaceae bacterium]
MLKKLSSEITTATFILIISVSHSSCNSNEVHKNSIFEDTSAKPIKQPVVQVDADMAKFARKPFVYDSTKTYIYLTFDDGPDNGTRECFNICKKEGIKSTFFMIGRNVEGKRNKQLATDIRNDYPQTLIANHSYTHTNERYEYFYTHPDMAEKDFYKAQDSLNVPYKIIRLPGNNAWISQKGIKAHKLVKAVCNKLDSAGYNVIGWDVEWRFVRGSSYPVQTPTQFAAEVNYAAKGHSYTPKHIMILTHDRMFRTPNYADSLTKFIRIIKQNPNYVFETVDNYPNLTF